ncbi:MAG: precorrin-6A/cobalt-precorrin-6A reductase, partial [Synergistaceae bacterium]|nr:precorrin-6A/cobalt-precorrin-6A reductase [Synergistaceae bacterium]
MMDSVKEKKILLMGGTTEGRDLFKPGRPLVYSAATEYGAELADAVGRDENILSGRMDGDRIRDLLKTGDFAGVIDATHPYATEVKLNISLACRETGTPLFRILRPQTDVPPCCDVTVVKSLGEAARHIERTDGNVLLT